MFGGREAADVPRSAKPADEASVAARSATASVLRVGTPIDGMDVRLPLSIGRNASFASPSVAEGNGLEDFRAPGMAGGAEERIRAGGGAVAQPFDPARPRQIGETFRPGFESRSSYPTANPVRRGAVRRCRRVVDGDRGPLLQGSGSCPADPRGDGHEPPLPRPPAGRTPSRRRLGLRVLSRRYRLSRRAPSCPTRPDRRRLALGSR